MPPRNAGGIPNLEKEATLIGGYFVHRPINSDFYFSSDNEEQLVLSILFFFQIMNKSNKL